MLMLVLMAGGCGSSQQAEKKSLFEHDHATPAHWPHNLNDLCRKFAARLDSPQASDGSDPSELNDLIAWIPEIAADSNLTEAEWLPICNAAESLQSRIEREGWTDQTRIEAKAICDLLTSEVSRLGESGGESEEMDYGHDHGHEHGHEHEHEHEHEPELGSVPITSAQPSDARVFWLAESNEGHQATYDAEFRR
jgi:hypothetical protein